MATKTETPKQSEAIVKAAPTQPEPANQITEVTPHGYFATLNRKPKGAHESTPWEIFQNLNGAKKPNFCCRERSKADAEAQMWKLDRAIAERIESLPKRTPEEAAEDDSLSSSPCDLLDEMSAAMTLKNPKQAEAIAKPDSAKKPEQSQAIVKAAPAKTPAVTVR